MELIYGFLVSFTCPTLISTSPLCGCSWLMGFRVIIIVIRVTYRLIQTLQVFAGFVLQAEHPFALFLCASGGISNSNTRLHSKSTAPTWEQASHNSAVQSQWATLTVPTFSAKNHTLRGVSLALWVVYLFKVSHKKCQLRKPCQLYVLQNNEVENRRIDPIF